MNRKPLAAIKNLATIDTLAGMIQSRAEQIELLLGVCEEEIPDMGDMRPEMEAARTQAWMRVASFVSLARGLADEVSDLGEAVEVQGAKAGRAAA